MLGLLRISMAVDSHRLIRLFKMYGLDMPNKEIADLFVLEDRMLIKYNPLNPHTAELNEIVNETWFILPEKAKKHKLCHKRENRPQTLSAADSTKHLPEKKYPNEAASAVQETNNSSSAASDAAAKTPYWMLRLLPENERSDKALELIRNHFKIKFSSNQELERKLDKINRFTKKVGSEAADSFFYAIWATEAVDELTNDKVLKFAEEIGSKAALEFFEAIGNTRAVEELTNEKVLSTKEFVKKIGSNVAEGFFYAIGHTKAVDELTSDRVLSTKEFVKKIGSPASGGFFHTIGYTKAVKELTSKEVLKFAEEMESNAARGLFYAIGSNNKAIDKIISKRVLKFAEEIGSDPAWEFFQEIGSTKAVDELTSDRVLSTKEFVKKIGSEAARGFFAAIGKTKAVKEFTSPSFLAWGLELNKDIREFLFTSKILKALLQIMLFSKSHGLCGEKGSPEEDPLIKLIGAESKEVHKINTNLGYVSRLVQNLDYAEKRGFGRVNLNMINKLNMKIQSAGWNTIFVASASDFINSKEDFELLFS